MAGFTDRTAQGILNHITGKSAIFTMPTAYLALFTAVGIDAGTGFTEPTIGTNGYARLATAAANWNAASGSAPSSISNAAQLTVGTSTNTGWGTIIAWGLYDAATAGNLLVWDFLGNFNWNPFTCTLATPGVITSPAHGYLAGDSVVVDTEYGGTLPTTAGSWAGLLTVASPTTDTFTAGVTTTSTGNGLIRKVSQQSVPGNIQVFFAAGNLIITSA